MVEGLAAKEGARANRLAELYERHCPDAIRLAYLLTGDQAGAEDLAHEAFVRVIGRFQDLRNPEAFGAYLRKAVINLSKMQFRRRSVERANLPRLATGAEEGSSSPTTDERVAVVAALLRLPERQRAAIVLRYYEDLSEAQIADVLRCRPGTVKSLLARGLAALRTNRGAGLR